MAKAPEAAYRCLSAVEQAAGREIKESEVDRIYAAVNGRIRRYAAEGMTPAAAAVRAGTEMGDDIRLAAAIEKRNILLNHAASRERAARYSPGTEAADIGALLTGREGRGASDAKSTDAEIKGLQRQVLAPFADELQKAGLNRVLAKGDKAFDLDVTRELWAIESGGKPATKNVAARTAAEIINRAQDGVRLLQNGAGAWIGKLEHYVTRQSHDMDKIRKAGLDAWIDKIAPRLDARTFDGLDEITPETVRAFLGNVYHSLASGVHERANGRVAWGDVGAGTGPANLAKRVSQERKLLFKDADAWAEYHNEFGTGSLYNSVLSGLEAGARNTALMRVWGPNPEAAFKADIDRLTFAAKDRGDFAAVDKLRGTWNERLFDTVTGKASIAGNSTIGNWTAAIAAWQTITKLGSVVLRSMPDLATNAAMLRHNGVGLFDSYANLVMAPLPKTAEGREAAALWGVGIDGMLGGTAARFASMDGPRGTSARLVETFHKLNLLSWWTDSMKTGASNILTHHLATQAERGFADLAPRLQNTLGRYGITPADWDVARAGATKAADGRAYLMPAHIGDDAVRTKFFTYINDQIAEGMNEPDAFSRTVATAGTQAGTVAGAAVRLLMQFKTYPITFMRRTMMREGLLPFTDSFGKGRDGGLDVMGITHLIVATSLLGFVSGELIDFTRGKRSALVEARDAGDYAKIVLRGMAYGGGFGFYGDLLFGEPRMFGGGPITSMLSGPAVGSLDTLAKELQSVVHGNATGSRREIQDAWTGATRLLKDNAPFVNMFYSRALMDYFIWYRLQEAANPGYLSRYEQRVKREQGQTFMVSPSNSPYR